MQIFFIYTDIGSYDTGSVNFHGNGIMSVAFDIEIVYIVFTQIYFPGHLSHITSIIHYSLDQQICSQIVDFIIGSRIVFKLFLSPFRCIIRI